MKKLILGLILLFPLVLLAQSVPVSPVAPSAPSLLSPAMIAIVAGIVMSLNTVLSSMQVLFAQWAKQEPGWLQSVSKFVLSVSKFLGSNPSV